MSREDVAHYTSKNVYIPVGSPAVEFWVWILRETGTRTIDPKSQVNMRHRSDGREHTTLVDEWTGTSSFTEEDTVAMQMNCV